MSRGRALVALLLCALFVGACRRRLQPAVQCPEKVNARDGSVLLLIPAGPFTMGSSEYRDAKPQFTLTLGAYYIGKYEVTNQQFEAFVHDSGYKAEGPWKKYATPDAQDHPVVAVSWYDAAAYCKWAGMRLPSEAEWEKAARGTDGRLYPWGDDWDADRCNNRDLRRPALLAKMRNLHEGRGTLPVGSFPEGASPFGALDMAGNAFEWTASAFLPYPYRNGEGREHDPDPVEVSLRGGSWAYENVGFFRTDTRSRCKPPVSSFIIGFRVAGDP